MTIDVLKWDKVFLGDIARSLTVAVKDPLSKGFDKYVGLEHIEPGSIHIKSWGNVANGTTFTRVFRKGQVLFGKRRAYQKKASLAEFDGVCSGDILVCEAIEGAVLPELLPFIVQSDRFFEHAIKTSAGSLSPRTKFKDLAKFSFRLPKLDKQKPIADLLWSIDRTVVDYEALLNCALKTRSVMLKTIYSMSKIKKVCISDLPIQEINGMWKTEENVDVVEASIIRSTEIQPFGEIAYDTAQIHVVKKSQFIDRKLKRGDIVVERSGGGPDQPVGRVCYFDRQDGNYTFSNFTSAIRITDHKVILPKYLHNFLLFFYENKGTDRLQKQTTGIRNLDYDLYRRIKIPLRELADQIECIDTIENIEFNRKKIFSQIVVTKNLQKQIINQVVG